MTGKITRARPKYLRTENLNFPRDLECIAKDELYFSSGRAALKFFLKFYSNHKNRTLNIGMQSFNCIVVAEAALQANCNIILFDIELDDYSISYSDLKSTSYNLDILLLTHYQGIPNKKYKEIASYCNAKQIILIDDIAQTEGSLMDDIQVGSLADLSLRSYAFDKPITCFRGGSLQINGKNMNAWKAKFIEKYNTLPIESTKKANLDIKTLRFLLTYSTPKLYTIGVNYYEITRLLIKMNFNFERIYRVINLPIMHFLRKYYLKAKAVIQKINSPAIKVKKMHKNKLYIINSQKRKLHHIENKEVESIKAFLTQINVAITYYPKNLHINWNRYSILDSDHKVKQHLSKLNIEASNYNWPKALHEQIKNHPNVLLNSQCKNSEIASKYIINIPTWSTFFQDYMTKKEQEDKNNE